MPEKKKISTTLWTIIIGVVINLISAVMLKVSFWEPIIILFKWIGRQSISVLNFPIKLWMILLALPVLYLAFRIIRRNKSSKDIYERLDELEEPDYLKYRIDQLKYWVWEWDWERNKQTKEWEIINMKPFCPKDETPLVSAGLYKTDVYCPRCGEQFSKRNAWGSNVIETEEEAKALIFANIRKKNYPSLLY